MKSSKETQHSKDDALSVCPFRQQSKSATAPAPDQPGPTATGLAGEPGGGPATPGAVYAAKSISKRNGPLIPTNEELEIDALRSSRIYRVGMKDACAWFEPFFACVAPWVDTREEGDQELTGSSVFSFLAGRVAVLAAAAGVSASDAWQAVQAMFVQPQHDPEYIAREERLRDLRRMPWQAFARRIRAVPKCTVAAMLRTEARSYAVKESGQDFGQFIAAWSFRAGALVTVGYSEGEEASRLIARLTQAAFLASRGRFATEEAFREYHGMSKELFDEFYAL